jgi:hypothetical protein
VTLLFVWACSSGGHEDASVTTSGGAGSEVAVGSGAGFDAEGGSSADGGAPSESGSAPSMNVGGSGSDPGTTDPEPSGGTTQGPDGAGGIDETRAGADSMPRGGSVGAGSAGSSSVGGAVAHAGSAGAPIVEPTCAPSGETSTDGLFLPCDVAAAFLVCGNCHSNPPVKSVNHSYVTYQDIKPMAAEIYGVIKSGYMPWPPYTMSAYARSVALKWLGKDGTCAVGATHECQP